MARLGTDNGLATEQLTHGGAAQGHEGPRFALVAYHRGGAKVWPLEAGKRVVVGRVPPADLVVPDGSLSRQHARFGVLGDEVVVEDLGSTNGTWLAGKPVEVETVRPGDVVVLGSVRTVIQAIGGRPRLGLNGHDAFLVDLERELVRARHFRRKAALVMLRSGDRDVALHEWAQTAASAARDVDLIGFYGGDNVELLLPEADESEARRILERIDLAVKATSLRAGVAIFPEAGTTHERLIEASRRALQATTIEQPIHIASSAVTVEASVASKKVIGESEPMRKLFAFARRVARGHIPVLLHGETGTGKEVVARFVHDEGPRGDKPLVAVNCAAIPPQLVESTLFGHVKGAFTGAEQARPGVFEAAQGGTVLLDEIGELAPTVQAALLRVLESKTVTRVGSTKEVAVDVRIIAASHRDLAAMVTVGSFREDLLYRLNAVTLELPPLREREDDVMPLAEHFLGSANESNGTCLRGFSVAATALLRDYAWPGNVRELRNVIERAVVIAEHELVDEEDLPQRLRDAEPQQSVAARGSGPEFERLRDDGESFRACMERLETGVLLEALEDAEGNQAETARRLQMPRRTLVHKIKVLGLKREDYAPED